MTIGLQILLPPRPGMAASYALRIPPARDLLTASFRPHLTVTALAVRLTVPVIRVRRGLAPPSECALPGAQQKGRRNRRPFNSSSIHLPSDEPFNVLLRTNATNHRSSSGLHGGTSISLASPPSFIPILNLVSPPCQEKSSFASCCAVPGKGESPNGRLKFRSGPVR